MSHLSTEALLAGLDAVRGAPTDRGTVALVVRRPALLEREVVERAELRTDVGLVGDNWLARGSRHTDDGSAEPGRQLTLMSARAIDLFAGGDRSRWPEAGDQLYVDFDLAESNAPAGTRLAVGAAVVEVSPLPHTGCAKFAQRFGRDALRLVATPEGKHLHLRGINAFVVTAGAVATGDPVIRL
ncbi:MAG: MOSC domain-containing protein [Acidimicrobiia bacterium]|nr:MOSC domain-containing protein [Acidimicrobiia bacterium]